MRPAPSIYFHSHLLLCLTWWQLKDNYVAKSCQLCLELVSFPLLLLLLFLPWANVNFVILCKRQKSKGHKAAPDTTRQEQLNGNFQTRPDERRLLAAIALPCNPAPALVTFVLSPSYDRIANLNSSIIDQTRLSPHAAWRIANERRLVSH